MLDDRQDLEPAVTHTVTQPILQTLRTTLYDRGPTVADWPEDEIALYRDTEGGLLAKHAAVEDLRYEKAARAVMIALAPAISASIAQARSEALGEVTTSKAVPLEPSGDTAPGVRDAEGVIHTHSLDMTVNECSCGIRCDGTGTAPTYAQHLSGFLRPLLATAYDHGHEDGFWDGKTTQQGIEDSRAHNPYRRGGSGPGERLSTLPTRGGAVVSYWDADGAAWIAHAGQDADLGLCWWAVRAESVAPHAPRHLSAEDLTAEAQGGFRVLVNARGDMVRADVSEAVRSVTERPAWVLDDVVTAVMAVLAERER